MKSPGQSKSLPSSSSSSKEILSGRSALYCESTSIQYVVQGNLRYWSQKEKRIASTILKKASDLDIRSGGDKAPYITKIKRLKLRDKGRSSLK